MLNFPANFGTSFKANMFPYKGNTGNKSVNTSQNSVIDIQYTNNYNNNNYYNDNNYNDNNNDHNSVENDDDNSFDNDENDNDNERDYSNNNYQPHTTTIISTEYQRNFQKEKSDNNIIPSNQRKIKISSVENTEMEGNSNLRIRPSSPTISPLNRKNLEIHSKRDFTK